MKFLKLVILNILIFLIVLTNVSCVEEFETLKITSYSPGKSEMNVSETSSINITFNNDVKKSDVSSTFTLYSNDSNIEGIIHWVSNKSFRFEPRNPLIKGKRYVIEIPRTIRDTKNNEMSSDFISDFYVGGDVELPEVISSTPSYIQGGASGIDSRQIITIDFNKSMNRETTEASFSISPDVSGYFEWSSSDSNPEIIDSRLSYILITDMEYGKNYTVSISDKAKDIDGNNLREKFQISFVTGDNFQYPTITGIIDTGNYDGNKFWNENELNEKIEKSSSFTIVFSKPMDRISTESALNINPPTEGYFNWENGDQVLVFTPLKSLESETIYRFKINSSAKDKNSMKMNSSYNVSFKTNAETSRHLSIGLIQGCNKEDGTYTTLYDSKSHDSDSWPFKIEMGVAHDPLSEIDQDYYITIQFVNSFDPYTPVSMDKYSILNDGYTLESFGIIVLQGDENSEPTYIHDSDTARVSNITWIDQINSTVKIKLSGLTNDEVHLYAILYRLTIIGGNSGIKDINNNILKENFIIEFKE